MKDMFQVGVEMSFKVKYLLLMLVLIGSGCKEGVVTLESSAVYSPDIDISGLLKKCESVSRESFQGTFIVLLSSEDGFYRKEFLEKLKYIREIRPQINILNISPQNNNYTREFTSIVDRQFYQSFKAKIAGDQLFYGNNFKIKYGGNEQSGITNDGILQSLLLIEDGLVSMEQYLSEYDLAEELNLAKTDEVTTIVNTLNDNDAIYLALANNLMAKCGNSAFIEEFSNRLEEDDLKGYLILLGDYSPIDVNHINANYSENITVLYGSEMLQQNNWQFRKKLMNYKYNAVISITKNNIYSEYAVQDCSEAMFLMVDANE